MFKLLCIIILVLVNDVYNQQLTGNPCTFDSYTVPAVCTLITKCRLIRDEVLFSQKLPQTCGFEGTQVIVCCPEFRRPGDISKKKCREYASHIQNETQCTNKIVKRIAGREETGRTEFPHMALIGFQIDSEDIQWSCGGSVISEQYILTTASCVSSSVLGPAKFILVGVTDIKDTSNRQEIKIVERIQHPEYNIRSSYNDIGLVKLEKPIQINSYVRPACLNTNSQITTTKAIVTGWGHTSWEGKRSDYLLKVTLNIVDYQVCNEPYGRTIKTQKKGIIDGMHICTEVETKDTCQGDTGSPLQIQHGGNAALCMYDILGVTLFGKRTCAAGPAVSTGIYYYTKWIEDIVWPESTQ